MHGCPAPLLRQGQQPLQRVGLQIGVGVEHQHPGSLQLLQGQVEGPGLAATGIGLPPQHPQERIGTLQFGQQLGGAVAAAIVDHPQPQGIAGIPQLGDALHQPADHGLFITGRHHHIHRRWGGISACLSRGWRRGRQQGGAVPGEGWQEHRMHAVATQQQCQSAGRHQPQPRLQPMGAQACHAADRQK